jgi:hypothetical protein
MSLIKLTKDANGDLHWVDPANGTDLIVFRQSVGDVYIPQGVALGRTPKTGNYTVLTTDRRICFTALAAAAAVTLPAASTMSGKSILVKDEAGAAATHNITVSVASSGTIDGAASSVISTNYGLGRYYSNGTQWFTE